VYSNTWFLISWNSYSLFPIPFIQPFTLIFFSHSYIRFHNNMAEPITDRISIGLCWLERAQCYKNKYRSRTLWAPNEARFHCMFSIWHRIQNARKFITRLLIACFDNNVWLRLCAFVNKHAFWFLRYHYSLTRFRTNEIRRINLK